MMQRTPEDDIYLIESLYCQGFTPTEIERETGISHNVVYYYTRIRDRFNSRYEYDRYLAKKRQRRKANSTFGPLIKRRLEYLERDRIWLANRASVSVTSISNYSTGRSLPREETQRKIFRALRLPHRSLDDLI